MARARATTSTPEADEPADETQPDPEPTVQAPRNVIEAIVAVMRDVKAVGKDGTNTQSNYKFRGIDGTVNALGPAMRKHGLVVTPHLKRFQYGEVEVGQKRTKQAHALAEVTYRFHHSNDDGVVSTLDVEVPGESMDSGDKATAKAMSVAFRIALLQTFALPTQEKDPDEETHVRSDALDPIAVKAALTAAVENASGPAEARAAVIAVADGFGGRDPLSRIEVPNNKGVLVNALDYVGQLVDYYATKAQEVEEAERARAAQDAAEQGDAPADAPEPPDARAEDAPAHAPDARDEAHAAATGARIIEQGQAANARAKQEREQPAAAPAAAPAREEQDPWDAKSDAQKWIAEGELQAFLLGQTPSAYWEPVTARAKDKDLANARLPFITARVKGCRFELIKALREQGEASMAAAVDEHARKHANSPMNPTKVEDLEDAPASAQDAHSNA